MVTASENTLWGSEERAPTSDLPARDATPPRRKGATRQRRQKIIAAPEAEAWSPRTSATSAVLEFGASIVEQFVAGHDASDVLRELVQNEFDGGGNRLAVTFGEDSLDVAGNGRGIRADGWSGCRSSSALAGWSGDDTERVNPKTNGIGSKNFALRSLFLFGDQIYVRSGGHVAILDLPTLETGRVRDPAWWRGTGVRLKVPYRRRTFEKLEPFTAEEENASSRRWPAAC